MPRPGQDGGLGAGNYGKWPTSTKTRPVRAARPNYRAGIVPTLSEQCHTAPADGALTNVRLEYQRISLTISQKNTRVNKSHSRLAKRILAFLYTQFDSVTFFDNIGSIFR